MAYNPFNVFRRNQKTLFAILTIVIMVIFTLSFGAGDIFQSLPNWLGRSGSKGEAVAKLNGSKIYEGDLQQINNRRAIASEFMVASNAIAAQKIETALNDGMPNVGKELRPQLLQLLQIRQGNEFMPAYASQDDFQELMRDYQNPQLRAFITRRGVERYRQIVANMAAQPDRNREDSDALKALFNLITLDSVRFTSGLGYFQHKGGGDDTLKSALDFDLWLAEADKLGIKYSEAEAQQMYLDEFYGQSDPKALAELEKNLFNSRAGYSRDTIFKSLADEFRVRVAQNVVLGRPNAPQFFGAPWEAYEFYRKQCNGGTYAVLTVPSENFLSKVTGTPTDSEMRKIFDNYRSREADPARDDLGLREPRKLKIGWLEVKGDEPYFKKLGSDALASGELHARAAVAATIPLPGGGFELLAAPLLFNIQDPALSANYAKYKSDYDVTLDSNWFPFLPGSAGPLTASMLKPGAIAATAGIAAGSIATHAGFLPAALVFVEKARIDDRAARAKALAAALTIPGLGAPYGPGLALLNAMPPALPLAVVRSELLEKVKAEAVLAAASRDLMHFETETGKLKPAEAPAAIAKYITERGLLSGESKTFDDPWNIGLDTGLQPLIDKAQKLQQRPDAPLNFGRSFFYEADPMTRREKEATKLFEPRPFPDQAQITVTEGNPVFMAWRTAEMPAETPRDFEKTKPRIVEMWKRMEARKLAAKFAEELANEVQTAAKAENLAARSDDFTAPIVVDKIVNDVFLRSQSRYATFAEKDRATRFTIEDVAPVSIPEERFPGQRIEPRQFQLLPRKVMPYPTFAMQQELLAKKDSPPATTLVLSTDSKDDYYVAVLKHRQSRTADDFYKQVYSGNTPLSNFIRQGLGDEEGRDLVKQTLALMRSEFKVEILNEKLK